MFVSALKRERRNESDVEMDSIGAARTDHSLRRLIHSSYETQEISRQRNVQRILQEGRPTFVPTFSSLREACLKRTREQLHGLELQIKDIPEEIGRNKLIEQATALLRDLDRQFDAIVDRHQLEDPEYAAQRGLSLTHFTLADKGDWMLLSSNWGADSRSITETNVSRLSSVKRKWLEDFAGGFMPTTVAFKRPKSVLERQRGAVFEKDGVLIPNPRMKVIWCILLGLGFAALICFLGVGIIAATAKFSEIFIRFFFWIAIVWTLASSTLLMLIVRAFGANGKDCMSAFLAGVAIWLVVIQIGQTKLNGQLGQD